MAVASALIGIVVLASQTGASPEYSDWSLPVNLGPVVNSMAGDDGPTMSKSGLSLYFYSTRTGQGGEDIWVSQRASTEEPWGLPANLGPLVNTAADERAPALSRDEQYLFFGSSRPGGRGGLDLWVSWRAHTHDDFAWEAPVNLGPLVNTLFNDTGPTFLESGDQGAPQFYFVSNRPGGFGLADIYTTSQGADGVFQAATRVIELSSPHLEAHPSIRPDGLEMFFSSNRPGGVGQTDIYTTTRHTIFEPWSALVNLGTSINTVFSDGTAGISPDRFTLIFFSNRPGGAGGDDLYVATRSRSAGQN